MGPSPGSRRRKLLVVAALITRGDRVLLTRRKAHQSFPGHWEFPGGKVERGESPPQALVREIQEEIGCRIQVGAVVEVVRHAYPEFDLVMPVYAARIRAGTPRPIEVAAVVWAPRRHLLRRKMPPADGPLARTLARACPQILDRAGRSEEPRTRRATRAHGRRHATEE